MRALQEQQRQLQADLDTHAALKLSAEQAQQVQLSHAFPPIDGRNMSYETPLSWTDIKEPHVTPSPHLHPLLHAMCTRSNQADDNCD